MRKLIFPIIFLVLLSLIFGALFVRARENEENEDNNFEEVEIKYKPEKKEVEVPKFSSRQLGPFKELDDFIRDKITKHPGANYFFLLPHGYASQQGVVEGNQNNVLTVNSQGFKMNWNIATETMVIASSKFGLLAQTNPQPVQVSDVATGTRVRIFGNWDGSQLVAKRIIVLERRVNIEVEDLIQKLKEALQKAGINIDLTPLLKQLQR
jgi:hypothetical protein